MKGQYYNYLDGEFADIEMYGAACLFMDQYYSYLQKTKYGIGHMCKKAGKAILKYFARMHLEELTSDFIIQLTSTTNFERHEILIINKFLLFLVDAGKIQNSIIKRITIFRERLEVKGGPEWFDRIFNCKRFDDFLNNNFFESNEGFLTFFIRMPKKSFMDERLYEVLSDRLEEMKFQFSSKHVTRIACTEFLYVCKEFFSNIKLEDITLEYLNKCLLKNKDTYYASSLRVVEALVSIESKGLIKNEGVVHLLSFKDYLFSNSCKLAKLIQLTGNRNIKRFVYFEGNYKLKKVLQYMNIECQEVFEAWTKFFVDTSYMASVTTFTTVCAEFDSSLSGFTIESLEDLNFDTFYAQIMYFSQYDNNGDKGSLHTSHITSFYLFLSQNYNPQIFESSNIDIKLLQRTRIVQELLEGYKIINYNPMDYVPQADKWLLSYADIQDTNMSINTTTSKIIDFTRIKSETYKYWVKHYVWNATASIHSKLNYVYGLIEFANYIYDLKHGIELSIYSRKTSDESITANEALAYKNYILNKGQSQKSHLSAIFYSSNLLKHILYNNLAKFETGVFYNLKRESDKKINPKALSNDDMSKLATFMKKNANNSIVNEVYYAILCLAIETEFRSSQILALTIDCIQEANKRNQYVLISRTKTSKGELLEQPLTIQTKKLLDHIIKLTSEYRSDCTVRSLKNQMFLLPGKKRGTYKIVSQDDFNRYLKKCCDKLGLEKYSLSNLRDTYMTKVENHIIKNGLSDMTKKILGGHSDPRSDKNYENTDIRTLLEAVHGIIIGNVDIKGQILREINSEIATTENSVYNECGYCGAKSCHDLSYIDCLMCPDFIATISRIPFFQAQIEEIDKKLLSITIRHDIEDFINIKRLLVEYLSRLLILKKRI